MKRDSLNAPKSLQLRDSVLQKRRVVSTTAGYSLGMRGGGEMRAGVRQVSDELFGYVVHTAEIVSVIDLESNRVVRTEVLASTREYVDAGLGLGSESGADWAELEELEARARALAEVAPREQPLIWVD